MLANVTAQKPFAQRGEIGKIHKQSACVLFSRMESVISKQARMLPQSPLEIFQYKELHSDNFDLFIIFGVPPPSPRKLLVH